MADKHLPIAVRHAASALAAAGVASPRVDAEILLAYVLDVPRSRLPLLDELTDAQASRFHELIGRRCERVPLQHLTGSAPFHELELAVGPGVFVPRPETELLVEWGIKVLAGVAAPVVVDLCAGSGAIGLALAAQAPGATVYAVERDPAALSWLRRNVEEQNPAVRVIVADVTAPGVLPDLGGRADLVLCNPPYVPDGVRVGPEVAGHDPAAAIFAGPDGLDVIRSVIPLAARLLRLGGMVGIEHDDSHGEAVPALLGGTAGFADVVDHPDLTGRPRFATARRVGGVDGLADCSP